MQLQSFTCAITHGMQAALIIVPVCYPSMFVPLGVSTGVRQSALLFISPLCRLCACKGNTIQYCNCHLHWQFHKSTQKAKRKGILTVATVAIFIERIFALFFF